MRWAHPDIVEICLAMAPFDLPLYVLLEIIDWVPRFDKVSHHKKIALIESVRNCLESSRLDRMIIVCYRV